MELTRTISLGIRQIGASDRPDLGIRRTASDPAPTRTGPAPIEEDPEQSRNLGTGYITGSRSGMIVRW